MRSSFDVKRRIDMKTTIGIAFIHLTILVAQALYMYFTYKDKTKQRRYLYLAALPIVTAVPIAINMQSSNAYNLYEYAILFCLFAAAFMDVCIATGYDRNFMSDENIRSFHCSYFMICTAVAYAGSLSVSLKVIFTAALVCLIAWLLIVKKSGARALAKAIPLTIISLACSWATCIILFKPK